LKKLLSTLCLLYVLLSPQLLVADNDADTLPLLDLTSALVFYGFWDDSDIPALQQFEILTLQREHYMGEDEKEAIQKIREAGTMVFLYISLGEDQSTYNRQKPRTGDGRGPSYYDPVIDEIVYQNKGIAGFYLDQWNSKGIASGSYLNQYSDGLPDRHTDGGACFVNPGDLEWQKIILAAAADLASCDIDGFYLNTVETPNPWFGFGWTAEGMYSLVKLLDDSFPDHLLLFNRGIFFFDPNNPYQFAWNPVDFVDITLFESYRFGNNYSDTDPEHYYYFESPYYGLNKYNLSPKANISISSHYRQLPMIQVDYARNPTFFPENFSDLYTSLLAESVKEQGRILIVSDRYLSEISTTVQDNPAAEDREEPTWQNSTMGKQNVREDTLFYNALGNDHLIDETYEYELPQPRIGIQKLIPSDGSLKVLWDVAADQTRPVKYHIYYTDTLPFNFETAILLEDVPYTLSTDYTDRGYENTDNACPFEYILEGLKNDTTYYVAVRAEDSTQSVEKPLSGAAGPLNGIEDQNTNILAAVPLKPDENEPLTITVDGNLEDWQSIPGIKPTTMHPDAEFQLAQMRVYDDESRIYFAIEKQSDTSFSALEILINTDELSYTGHPDFFGADYRLYQGKLYEYAGEWKPSSYPDPISKASTVNRLEIAVSKTAVNTNYRKRFYIILRDNASGSLYPDAGSAGTCIALASPRFDTTPPVFSESSFIIDSETISQTVVVTWPEAKDDSGTVLYDILYTDTGEIVYNNNGYPNESLKKNQKALTGLPLLTPSNITIAARDLAGNISYSRTIQIQPQNIITEPVWLESRSEPIIALTEEGYSLYFNPALDGRFPANYDVHVKGTRQPKYEDYFETIAFLPSDNPDYDYYFPIENLEPLSTYNISLYAAGRQGMKSTDVKKFTLTVPGYDVVSLRTIDGYFEDWEKDRDSVKTYTRPFRLNINKQQEPFLDSISYVFREDRLFLRASTRNMEDHDRHLAFFIDIDKDTQTGFSGTNVGAEFVLLGNGQLYSLSDGGDWNAEYVGTVQHKTGIRLPSDSEYSLPESFFGEFPDQMSMVVVHYEQTGFIGKNTEYGPLLLNRNNQPVQYISLSGIVLFGMILLIISLIILVMLGLSEKRKSRVRLFFRKLQIKQITHNTRSYRVKRSRYLRKDDFPQDDYHKDD